ncbi:hypothetical protein [Candidatus Bathycorpusculum sp.]|uniref:hypothetical protein n=1 Tax=Candidatus Bathycorpusculum sp. TaxID=2994959 RepID=UPI0028392C30|nr:hypothetical protein [Candidatus Termitimicrobium sp.]MCL2431456.1 hypothetical protein [Candidatus Termitimicrobium sp.]
MKDKMSLYKIWAPDNALWTQWTKPVLFASLPCNTGDCELKPPSADHMQMVDYNAVIIVDLPGKESVDEGLVLAQCGYRPVPLYNGVYGNSKFSMIVDVQGIAEALQEGADMLSSLNIRADAPPVFLLDSNRMTGQGKQPGKYDNRWCVFPQDMPSASFLLKNGIQKIIVRSTRIQEDLAHILLRYQNQGINIFLCSNDEILKEIKVSKPSLFMSFFYRFKVTLGLSRNATGGFGAVIPEPQIGWSNRSYYWYG